MRKCRVTGDRVLVRAVKETASKNIKLNEKTGAYEEFTDSGMFIKSYTKDEIESMQLSNQEVEVVQLGNMAYKMLGDGEPWCKVGDKIQICRYSGEIIPMRDDDYTYRLISDSDCYLEWLED